MFPSDYISSTSERMALYGELDAIADDEKLDEFKSRLRDRFGAIPTEADDLMKVIPLRRRAIAFGVERILLRNGRMTLYLVSKPDSPYYRSEAFGKMISYVSRFPKSCRIGESSGRRYISVEPVNSLDTALRVLDKINNCDEA